MSTIQRFAFNPALNGLRGVAIIIVMVFHAMPQLLIGGFIGVDIFFVLSGFLITTLLLREHAFHGQLNLKAFYLRRFLRLAPALVFMLIAFCSATYLFATEEVRRKFIIDSVITFLYLSNWARAFDLHPPDFLGHTWSLAIEEQFYLLWPFFLMITIRCSANRHVWLMLAAGLGGCSIIWRAYLMTQEASPMRLYNGLDTRMDALMTGCALAIVLSLDQVRVYLAKGRSKTLSLLAVISCFGVCLFTTYGQWNHPQMLYWGYTLVALFSATIIADLTQEHPSLLRKILSVPALVRIGTISYGLYLWHFPIFRILFLNGWTQTAVFWVGSLITLLIATLSYYLIESHFLKLKNNRLDARW